MWRDARGSFRLAAYAVCVERRRVLLARSIEPDGGVTWTLPGGGVEHGEDPIDAVRREFAEESGCEALVERLLGVDSRLIPPGESRSGTMHHNVGIFYRVRIATGAEGAATAPALETSWVRLDDVGALRRSSLVDVGLALLRRRPATGHGPGIAVGGLVRH